jgi:hypothetical protein
LIDLPELLQGGWIHYPGGVVIEKVYRKKASDYNLIISADLWSHFTIALLEEVCTVYHQIAGHYQLRIENNWPEILWPQAFTQLTDSNSPSNLRFSLFTEIAVYNIITKVSSAMPFHIFLDSFLQFPSSAWKIYVIFKIWNRNWSATPTPLVAFQFTCHMSICTNPVEVFHECALFIPRWRA